MLFSLLVSVLFFRKTFSTGVYTGCDDFWITSVKEVLLKVTLGIQAASEAQNSLDIYVTGSGKRYIVAHIFKIELFAPRGRVSSQL